MVLQRKTIPYRHSKNPLNWTKDSICHILSVSALFRTSVAIPTDTLTDQSRGSHLDNEIPERHPSYSQSMSIAANIGPNVADAIQHLLTPSGQSNQLPNYIRRLPQRLQAEDLNYLQAKGALTIPDRALRDELLKAYIHYVHPYMPLLDLEEFLQILARNDGTHHVSLLLFQAVMFAGTAFVDMEALRNAGYDNRKSVRKVFFQRARVC